MRRLLLALVLLAGTTAPAVAQSKGPKADSLLVIIALPKTAASDAVVAAFTAAGLLVTDQTGSLITSDEGVTQTFVRTYSRHRVVRATLVPVGPDSTRVLIQGTEDLIRGGQIEKRKRIDSHAQHDGGKVWAKMLVAARALDSTS